MSISDPLPADFIQHLAKLEAAYLRESDPIRQSGSHGGRARWRAERSPILRSISGNGTLLDVGCANGYLLESLIHWGSESGLTLTPYCVDCSAGAGAGA
jgi:2-polyprenyl-3-methyl-5-hydroxy-6-metoxy-1,4-benzoquinol methylase